MSNPTFTKNLFLNLKTPINPVIFLDINIGEINNNTSNYNKNSNIYRLYFELFADKLPKTCENFRRFCTGETINNNTGLPYGYKNTKFHRLVKNFIVQGGDFINFDGTGSFSIYGNNTFPDENFIYNHNQAGLLSMANSGPNTNGCQFFITLNRCDELNSKHVVFGKAIDDFTLEVLKIINEIPSDFMEEEPLQEIRIVNCGQM